MNRRNFFALLLGTLFGWLWPKRKTRKGMFIAEFKVATRPDHAEWYVPVFHFRKTDS